MHHRVESFTETRVMTYSELPPAHRRSVGFTLFACGCAQPRLARAPRSWWMFLWLGSRMYKCGRCGLKVLRPRLPKRELAPVFIRNRYPIRGASSRAAASSSLTRAPVVHVAIQLSSAHEAMGVVVDSGRHLRVPAQAANNRAYQ